MLIFYFFAYKREDQLLCLTCIYMVILFTLSLFKRGPVCVSYLYIQVDTLSLSLFKRGLVVLSNLNIQVDTLSLS